MHQYRKRASYREALEWIVQNDDCAWLQHPADTGMGSISTTASLVADLWHKSDEDIREDLIKAYAKHRRPQ